MMNDDNDTYNATWSRCDVIKICQAYQSFHIDKIIKNNR